jgi:hypothetical protein
MIKFIEESHEYFDNEIKLDSVSAVISDLKPKKDWKKIAQKYAKKHGETAEFWQKRWDEKKKLGTGAGTILHKIEEDKTIASGENVVTCNFEGGIKWSIPINNLLNNTVYVELMIYDTEAGVCGQSDKVITKNKTINIHDYKTDKSIETKGYTDKYTGITEKFLPPCEHLDYCNYNEYSLKMSMYMYMLWKQNKSFEVGDITIEHIEIQRDEEEIPVLKDGIPIVLKRSIIKLPYREKEVKKILNDRKTLRKNR